MLCSPKPTKCSALPGSRSGRRAFFPLPGKVEKPFLSAVFVSPGAEAAPQDVTEEPGDGSSSSREQHGLPWAFPRQRGGTRDARGWEVGWEVLGKGSTNLHGKMGKGDLRNEGCHDLNTPLGREGSWGGFCPLLPLRETSGMGGTLLQTRLRVEVGSMEPL